MKENEKRLVGIKAIAQYLGVSERTVQRWMKKHGLPVKRVAEGKGQSVVAFTNELDAWSGNEEVPDTKEREKPEERPKPVRILRYLLVALIFIALVVSVISVGLMTAVRKNPEIVDYQGDKVSIKTTAGEALWSLNTGWEIRDAEKASELFSFYDFDNDGLNEVAASEFDVGTDTYYLTLFDHDGKRLWRRTVGNTQSFDGVLLAGRYRPDWVVFHTFASGETAVFSCWTNRVRFQSILTWFDLVGNQHDSYLNLGNVGSCGFDDIDGDGEEEVLFCGTNNLLDGEGVICVLPARGFRGISPPYRVEPEHEHMRFRLKTYVPDNPERGNQLFYLRFKRTNILEKDQLPYIFPDILETNDKTSSFMLPPFALRGIAVGPVFVFDKKFVLEQVFPASLLLQFYPEVLANGDTDVPLDELMRIFSDTVYRWDGQGWAPNPKAF